ncbi:hypothetical protein V5799_028388 [Amblyomma americanum]|uniref:Uncharacterized protein n=1 Tax=Amblyomma americanum TaxID=6943 RepID=A0AAQ4DD05_AMBAM
MVCLQEIFPNKSHLPTYSSPAIETHLHRIQGLSQRFIYLNDDVFFGKEVWPEDFYTHAAGYKVRLAWPVPDCALGCPTTWVKDGYCDKPCNNSKCEWDGRTSPSCTAARAVPTAGWLTSSVTSSSLVTGAHKACNVLPCAFDAGDCGTTNYRQLYALDLSWDERNYSLPSGQLLAYFNLSGFLGPDDTMTDGHYEENPAVRLVAISLPSKVVTIMLFPNSSATTVDMTIRGLRSAVSFEFKLTLTSGMVIPTEELTTSAEPRLPKVTSAPQPPVLVTEETVNFTGYADHLRHPPLPALLPDGEELYRYADVDVRRSVLPEELVRQIVDSRVLYTSGLLTLKGFRKHKSQLIEQYVSNATMVGDEGIELVFRRSRTTDITVMNETASRPPHRTLLGLREGWLPWEKQNLFGALMKVGTL